MIGQMFLVKCGRGRTKTQEVEEENMFGKKRVQGLIFKALKSGSSPEKLSLSFAIGMYIAWCPFVGMHTIMMLSSLWIFKLNFPVLAFSTMLNNPWTILGFCSSEYAFGYWIVHYVIGWEPGWQISLEKIFGSGKICVWSFFIGGNIVGIVTALVSYPILLIVFKKIARQQHVLN